MVDVDPDTLMVDTDTVAAAITKRTKAIIPVHYAGAALDLDPLRALAQCNGIPLIEDAAHAAGTRYRQRWIGSEGTAIFSLHAIKNLTCAEGGVLATDDAELAARVRRLKFHGLGIDAFDRQRLGRDPQAEVVEPGYKYNLSDIHAALAVVQLRRLTQMNTQRRQLAQYYLESLASSPLLPLKVPDYSQQHAWHLFIVRVDPARCGMGRDTLMAQLKSRNIGSAIHFRAAHTQQYYRQRYPKLSLPHSEWNSERLCSLPLFPDMQRDDVDRVVATLSTILER